MKYRILAIKKNYEDLSEAIDKCKGDIKLITSEGDQLNLKSRLCQLLTINVIISSAPNLSDLYLYIEKEEDAINLTSYFMVERA